MPDSLEVDTPIAQEAPQKPRGVGHYIGLGLGAGLLLIVVALALILIVIPKVGGATPLTVLTQSMEPLYPPGSLMIVRPVKPADIRIGDVVTYQISSGRPDVISHRVVGIESGSDGKRTFIFKGDNNSVADFAPVIPAQIKGRLWYAVPLAGWVNAAVNGSNRSWIVDVIAALFLAYAGYMIASGIYGSARKRAKKRLLAESSTV
jgi:signal peptidase